MSQITLGFKYLLAGFGLILKPGVRLYVVVPLLINTLIFATVIYLGAEYLDSFIDSMVNRWQWLEWLIWLIWPLFIIIALTIVFFSFSIIANLIGAPFNVFLTASVERRLRGTQIESETNHTELINIIVDSMRAEFQKLMYFVVRALPLLILFFIPFVQISAPFLWLLFSAWMLAIEYTDYPMGNHDIPFKDQRIILSNNKPLVIGFGMGVMLLTLMPVLNFIAMPVAVAGATKMFVEHAELGQQ